ncbi:hypothetical protein JG559_07720 [Enterococcus faecalis]|uniref:Uncharacterized protein n=1 Tax=Enterococcus faecalis TaxID=1351 RepID=A0A974S667_ENTFL|nr:hypothetical protein JG559_07720 [Enterococcus faecalis]
MHIFFQQKSNWNIFIQAGLLRFVGIGVIPNTSQLFINELGKIVFWVALFFYLLLLPILIKRITKSKEMPESTIPLLTIMTAPGSLCLAGYISMGGHLYMPLVVFLANFISMYLWDCSS